MNTINIDFDKINTKKFKSYLRQYLKHNGYETPIENLPTDIIIEESGSALFTFSALHINVNQEFIINFVGCDMAIKCKKIGKYEIVVNPKSLIASLDIDENDPMLQILGNINNYKHLAKDEKFIHPLMEVHEMDGQQVFNGYGVATMFINAIRNPDMTNDNGKSATDNFKRFLLEASVSVKVEYFLEKIKVGHLGSMMKASTLINDGFEKITRNALEN